MGCPNLRAWILSPSLEFGLARITKKLVMLAGLIPVSNNNLMLGSKVTPNARKAHW